MKKSIFYRYDEICVPIGTIFLFRDQWLKCVKGTYCGDCIFDGNCCDLITNCNAERRIDNEDVMYIDATKEAREMWRNK